MKLNLGCGTEYKAGYVNIDAYDLTVADRAMEVTDLKYQDNIAESIEASQLIEHLGFIRSLYALSDWFRVLKPKGFLLIETPDLDTSFKEYLKSKNETKKELLFWIYGFDNPGMQHKFCFSYPVLHNLLKITGFINIKKKIFLTHRYEPVLQVICEKPHVIQPYQTIAKFRKKLHKKGIIDLNNQIITQDMEKIIDIFVSKIKKYMVRRKGALINEIVIEGAIHSPILVKLFLEECLSEKLIEQNSVQNHLNLLENLERLSIPNLLFHSFRKTPIIAGEQEKIFGEICDFGRNSINNMINSSDEVQTTSITILSKLYEELKNKEKINYFSEFILKYKAYILHSKGRKFFSLNQYREAISAFLESISLYRNDPICFWNLARALAATGNYSQAIENYKNSIQLKKYLNPIQSNNIVRKLNEELAICYNKANKISSSYSERRFS